MHKFYIDTTDRKEKLVRLFEDGALVEQISGDIDVVSKLKDLAKKYKLNLLAKDITVEANPGPGAGSFTGIKVGVVIENIINWVAGRTALQTLTKPEYGREPNISDRKVA